MKPILILLICCAVVAAYQGPRGTNQFCVGAYLRGVVRKCAAAYRATQEDIDDYINLRWAATENAKCFRACIFNECQTFSPDGTFRFDLPRLSAFLVSRVDAWKWSVAGNAAFNCLYKIPTGRNRCDITEAYLRCLTASVPGKLTLIGGI